MSSDMIAQVRRFNRTVTQRAGVLYENYLASGRSLGQDRVLWEIGANGCDVRDLRSRLDLDSGYLSRLLRALQRDGLITVEPQADDRRVRTVWLTQAGRSELQTLNARSDDAAAAILTPLTATQQTRLVEAMAEVERLLTASTVRIAECDPRRPEARFCLDTYYAELAQRFPAGYDPAVSPVADEEMTPPAGLLLVASLHGQPVGCGALIWYPDAVALVKRMWVAPSARGIGLGRRMLSELESRARDHGDRLVRLDTNAALTEALNLYRTCGYREVAPFSDEPYANHWFEKSVAESV
ncbi:MarR family transcriptional regulator [Mycolicibacterium wolinskyi]|uniref:MarR family transcriptional regulator n=1 Tax=Mycolicibacterium wolinskyi TaxID=59750 RepID=A0A1X2F600_9MYCO|nr:MULTISPECIES: helix-turn-helix domain-containing GNAT family N-acetyltransferase [Mycolicibacterium]MCV7284137.1 MarR family transcriptional regulator [Mycolicibacterium wolinskyi]MCV7293973.1 MarR family transcriptional regulator [Mycolicibacterium goodii]ORX13870.1 MarR family transcriptional regulator [Mycolicibacterium wolinskyi]